MKQPKPFEPPSLPESKTSQRAYALRRVLVCGLSWPALVLAGWLLGDRNGLAWETGIWNGPFSLPASPGFQLVLLTLLPFVSGLILAAARPQKRLGVYWALGSALLAGAFAWLLAFGRYVL